MDVILNLYWCGLLGIVLGGLWGWMCRDPPCDGSPRG